MDLKFFETNNNPIRFQKEDFLFMNHINHWENEYRQENISIYKVATNMTQLLATTLMPALNSNCIQFYSNVRQDIEYSISLINFLNYFIISIGILFNILNLIVLLNSKLNESPYTYLTVLALSDLGSLLMLAFEKIRQLMIHKDNHRLNIYIEYSFIYVITPVLNTFLSCSMYVTLALTIERFIFVHSPFKAMSICHRSIARRVCLGVFIFSVVRSIYLPFMYKKNECVNGSFVQLKIKSIDIYEFLISLAIPYTIIFIVNISLIFSLNKQNSLMTLSHNQSFIFSNNHNNNPNAPIGLATRIRHNSSSGSIRTQVNTIESQRLFEEKETKPKVALRQTSIDSGDLIQDVAVKTKDSYSIPILNNVIKPSKLYHRTSSSKEMKNQKKLTTSLIMILCSLLVCYAPSFLFEESLADVVFGELKYEDQSEESARLFKLKGIGYRISLVCIYINCSFNFLIYCISNKKFKNSLKSLVKKSFLYNYFKAKSSCFNTKQQIGSIRYSMQRADSRNWHELVILNRAANLNRHLSSRNTSISTRLTNSLRSSCENNLQPNL